MSIDFDTGFKGNYTKTKPNALDKKDILCGQKALKKSGNFSFTQGAICRNNKVVAIEGSGGTQKMIKKVKKINKIRAKNSEELVSKGEEPLEPYVFDYILLCNKICGASHYNMQMKIIVETEDKFKKWMSNQQTFAQFIQ